VAFTLESVDGEPEASGEISASFLMSGSSSTSVFRTAICESVMGGGTEDDEDNVDGAGTTGATDCDTISFAFCKASIISTVEIDNGAAVCDTV
jgi:hypothetical protein